MSVIAPPGFAAAGVASGIKPTGEPDLALVTLDPPEPAPAAATFTTNKAAAAPVQVSRAHLDASGGRAVAVVLNSGCANAATGDGGRKAARHTCELVATQLDVRPEDILVCSTGLIGTRLPIEKIEAGVPPLVAARGGTREAGMAAARAIMTTDTRPKETLVSGHGFVVGGMAKGAAMLAPNMATMLAVLTTDARVTPAMLHSALGVAVGASFNELTVDGCASTNDTVVVLASGRGGEPRLSDLTEALTVACRDLAHQMAADAEGATRVVRVTVSGAADPDDARRAARRVAESQLVKCSLYGADPYWGRVVSELGSAGARFDLDRVSVAYGPVTVCRGGAATRLDPADEQALAQHINASTVDIRCDLGLGSASAEVLTTDLGPGYIEENRSTS